MTVLLPAGALATLLDRASVPGVYDRWHQQVRGTGFCSNPVRLRGHTATVNAQTGELLTTYRTSNEPDGVLLVACRNRRATRCPSCAETYRQDSFHLIAAGLRGGKGIPDSVATHPRVFLTLTAPSFGSVHTARDTGDVCHRRRSRDRCEHGQPRGCWRRHQGGDVLFGQPLCALCFDYDRAVLWNAVAPELWRRTTIAIRRQLAMLGDIRVRQLNKHVRLRFTKVIEYQERGAIHIHAVLRLDGPNPDSVTAAGPAWTVELLQEAIRRAVQQVSAPLPSRDTAEQERARWGAQLDVRPLPRAEQDEDSIQQVRAVAAYIAKYATKSTDPLGALDRRLLRGEQIDALNVDEHHRELVETAWQLGGQAHLTDLKLRRWAHTLGYRGHWATRSRRYSTTLTALRETRQHWRKTAEHRNHPGIDLNEESAIVVVAEWSYAGSGYRTPGDAWLAHTAQQRALEARRERRTLTHRVGDEPR
jgi:hypothetical protein